MLSNTLYMQSMSTTTPPRKLSHLHQPPESPTITGTPTIASKPRGLHSVVSVPSMHSFGSFQSLQSQAEYKDMEHLDGVQLGCDPLYCDFDQFDTTDIDPLSPRSYELCGQIPFQQQSLMTPELSGSVSSGASMLNPSLSSISGSSMSWHSNGIPAPQNGNPSSIGVSNQQLSHRHHQLLTSNVEGLGIAESIQATLHSPSASPDNSLSRRVKVSGPTRVSKKSSKQTLKQRLSRTSLNGDTVAPQNQGMSPTMPYSPNRSNSTTSSLVSIGSMPLSPQKKKSVLTSTNGKPMSQSSNTNGMVTISTLSQKEVHAAHPGTPINNLSASRLRGKAAASPAMRSPNNPNQNQSNKSRYQHSASILKPHLPAAAAATAVYSPSPRASDQTRQNAMAAAAAAAAASASASNNSGQQLNPLPNQQLSNLMTPLADKQGSRVSPSTLLVTVKTGAGNSHSFNTSNSMVNSVSSPTPAARMSSSSKLVSEASDSSPAKGMWQQKPRRDVNNNQSGNHVLSRPIVSPRKSASTSNIRKDSRRKSPKVIPEMSSSLNQFQVELKPRTFLNRAPKSAPSQLSQIHLPNQTQTQTQTQIQGKTPTQTPVQQMHLPPGQLHNSHLQSVPRGFNNMTPSDQLAIQSQYEVPMYDMTQHWPAMPNTPPLPEDQFLHQKGIKSALPASINPPGSDISNSCLKIRPNQNPQSSDQHLQSKPISSQAVFGHSSMPLEQKQPMGANTATSANFLSMPASIQGSIPSQFNRPTQSISGSHGSSSTATQNHNNVDHNNNTNSNNTHSFDKPTQHVWVSQPQPVKSKMLMVKQEMNDQSLVHQPVSLNQKTKQGPCNAKPLNIQQQQQQRLEQQQQLFQERHQQQLLQVQQQQQQQQQQHPHNQENYNNVENVIYNGIQADSGAQGSVAQDNMFNDAQDTSFNADFISQFINTDEWGTEGLDLNIQWDLMDTLETPI